MNAYLSALRSVHIDRRLSVDVSDSLWLPRIMHGYRATFPPSIRKRLPITKPILTSVTSKVSSLDDMNGSVAFLVAWAGFLRVGEITYNILPSGDPTFTAKKIHPFRHRLRGERSVCYPQAEKNKSAATAVHQRCSATIRATLSLSEHSSLKNCSCENPPYPSYRGGPL
jgi:hypothetical protein